MLNPRAGRPAGIYVHIPFCRRLCPYCDFAVSVRKSIPHREYADAIIGELTSRRDELAGRRVETLYFGGGTPSLLDPGEVARIRAAVDEVVDDPEAIAEVTLEANPLDVTDSRLAAWQQSGVGRISLGVQSFDDGYLARLGRDHHGAAALDAVRRVTAAGLAVNVDLIFAGPQYNELVFRADLAALSNLQVDHVSAYQLTVEPATVFFERRARGELQLPDEDRTADLFDDVQAGLEGLGFERYEVSNYARPGRRSRHNTGYWTGSEYVGVGTGAHSLRIADGAAWRRANPRSLKRYLGSVGEPEEVERLSAETHLRERLFLAARTRVGIPVAELHDQFGARIVERVWAEIADLVDAGIFEEDSFSIRPTRQGLDVGDMVAQRLIEASGRRSEPQI